MVQRVYLSVDGFFYDSRREQSLHGSLCPSPPLADLPLVSYTFLNSGRIQKVLDRDV